MHCHKKLNRHIAKTFEKAHYDLRKGNLISNEKGDKAVACKTKRGPKRLNTPFISIKQKYIGKKGQTLYKEKARIYKCCWQCETNCIGLLIGRYTNKL